MPGKHLLSRLLAVLLLAGTAAIPAQQDLPCAPFRDGRIDPRLVAIMLAAAEHGHRYRVDPAHSRIGFCVDSHFMHIEGYFREFQGGMALHPHEDAADCSSAPASTGSRPPRLGAPASSRCMA